MNDDKATEHRYEFARPEMLAFIPAGIGRVLDVGCATGAFAYALRARSPGLDIWGVESDPAAVPKARSRLDSLVVGEFPEKIDQLPLSSFDCVVFNDVLEHMVEPGQALSAAARLLSSDGRVVASIPNIRHVTVLAQLIGRGDFMYTDIGILDRTHLRFFTRRSMLRLFANSGWQVEQITGINWLPWSRLPVWPQRWLCRLARGRLDEFFYQQYAIVAKLAT